ncbi:MAG: DUF2063 domain-containing protein [Methylocella sp.]
MPEAIRPFQRLQYAFAASIRDPENQARPQGVPAQRMQIYQNLIYNNVESFLASGFPVLKATLGDATWQALIRDFLRRHQSKTPYLAELGEEFLTYLQDERGEVDTDPPFLLELAHYEWVELALLIADTAVPAESPTLLEDPLSQTIYLSELAWPLAYRFPVHRVGPEYRPHCAPAEPSFLLVYRGRDDRVRFLEISSSTYQLLDVLCHTGPADATTAVAEIAATIAAAERHAFASSCRLLLTDLAQRAVIGAV